MEDEVKEVKDVPFYLKFVFATISGAAATIFYVPFEVIRSRLKILPGESLRNKGKRVRSNARSLFKKGGWKAFYTGFDAGITRQISYSTIRLGMYHTLFDFVTEKYDFPPSFYVKTVCAVVAGSFGGVISYPLGRAQSKLISDSELPFAKRKHYKNALNTISRIIREEGFRGVFKGSTMSLVRSTLSTVSSLVTYEELKDKFIENGYFRDTTSCHLVCSLVSASVTTLIVSPFNAIEMRLQIPTDMSVQYKGILDCFMKIIKTEGYYRLWMGCFTDLIHNSSHLTILFLVYEQLLQKYKKLINVFEGRPDERK